MEKREMCKDVSEKATNQFKLPISFAVTLTFVALFLLFTSCSVHKRSTKACIFPHKPVKVTKKVSHKTEVDYDTYLINFHEILSKEVANGFVLRKKRSKANRR